MSDCERGEGSGGGDCPKLVSIKEDWYQTESQVVVVLLAKNVDASKTAVDFEEDGLRVSFPYQGSEYLRRFELKHGVVVNKCSFKVYSTKVEIKLTKAEGLFWSKLEKEKTAQEKKPAPRNWDRVVAELEEEQPEGEAALNALFQKIYREGSDDVKKAMNKSFLESGGTELNTNWDTVGRDRVAVKPPDGMEWKAWAN